MKVSFNDLKIGNKVRFRYNQILEVDIKANPIIEGKVMAISHNKDFVNIKLSTGKVSSYERVGILDLELLSNN